MIYTVVVPILAGLIVGRLRGGRMDGLATLRFRYLTVVFVLFILQLLSQFIHRQFLPTPWLVAVIFSSTYVGLCIVLLLNFRLPGAVIAGGGVALNALVIIANGGRMPVIREALISSADAGVVSRIEAGLSGSHVLMTESTRLWLLGDILHFPVHWRFHSVFSIGDVFLALGLFLLVQHSMLQFRHRASTQPH